MHFANAMVTRVTNVMIDLMTNMMTDIRTNIIMFMTKIDGIHENRDDQFTEDQVTSLGKSSQPYGARSLSKITNTNTAFFSDFLQKSLKVKTHCLIYNDSSPNIM